MAHTPDDPTKAQVWITKGLDDLDFEFYFPQGPKGEPGGVTHTQINIGENLNDFVSAGFYRVSNAADAAASAVSNLPIHESGTLLVTSSQTAGIQIQTYISNTKGIFVRRKFSGSWNSWRHFGTSRVDQTAGRAMYHYDELNAREQLIYGDTGWRDVTSLAGAAWTSGNMFARRFGALVEVVFNGVTLSATLQNSTIVTLPTGFRPSFDSYMGVIHGPTRQSRSIYVGASGALGFNNANASEVMLNRVSFMTTDTWPTTLPGSASGTIPVT